MDFLARRVMTGALTILGVTFLVFGLSRIQGDPRSILISDDASIDQWQEMGEQLGLDQPVYKQYTIYVVNLVQGELGTSTLQKKPVAGILLERGRNSVQLAVTAFSLTILIGVPLGVLSAVKTGGIYDYAIRIFAVLGQALPSYWVGLLLILIFAVGLDWLPAARKSDWTSLVLPALALGWLGVSGQIRIIRSSMLDILDSEYVRLARAKGVTERMIIWKHVLRNAIVSPVTFGSLTFASMLTGSIVVETVFAWPGLGLLSVNALNNSDYPILQGVILIAALVYVLFSFVTDVVYMMIDPRIRIQ